MERLREAIGLHPDRYRLDERLVELTFGSWEGMTWKEVRKHGAAIGGPARARQMELRARPAAARATPCWPTGSVPSSTI